MGLRKILNLEQGLTKSRAERQEQVKALRDIFGDEKYKDPYLFLYENLSILDSKASSLLTFNALGLAAISFWLRDISADLFHVVLDIAFLMFLVSCLLCLRVVRLWWSPTGSLRQRDAHLEDLIRRRDKRTYRYRVGWWLSCIAVVAIVLASTIHSIGIALYAFGICEGRCQQIFKDGSWGIQL